MNRYSLDTEDEFEPGSNGTVLRNLVGITDEITMGIAESSAYERMTSNSLAVLDDETPLSVDLINDLHRQWLEDIYQFAGRYREVNVSKSGFMFCAAPYIPEQMLALDKTLALKTPMRVDSDEKASELLAEVHGEFILIHPYREGNGRLGRWIACIMALQSGRPILDFGAELIDTEAYFHAVRRFASDPTLLSSFFLQVLRRSRSGY